MAQSPATGHAQQPAAVADEDEWGELAGPAPPEERPSRTTTKNSGGMKHKPSRTTTNDSGVDLESDPFARLSKYDSEPPGDEGQPPAAEEEADADFAPFVSVPPTTNNGADDDDPFAEIVHRPAQHGPPILGDGMSAGASSTPLAPPQHAQFRGPPAPPRDPFADLLS